MKDMPVLLKCGRNFSGTPLKRGDGGSSSGADPGYILTTAQFRLSEILGCGSLDAGVAL